ncbi:unnamed protein product, partial [Nesidiocoris tenuis]
AFWSRILIPLPRIGSAQYRNAKLQPRVRNLQSRNDGEKWCLKTDPTKQIAESRSMLIQNNSKPVEEENCYEYHTLDVGGILSLVNASINGTDTIDFSRVKYSPLVPRPPGRTGMTRSASGFFHRHLASI